MLLRGISLEAADDFITVERCVVNIHGSKDQIKENGTEKGSFL